MNAGPADGRPGNVPASEVQRPGVPLPLARPFVTYVLLALIVLVFLADVILSQLAGYRIVADWGAQFNRDIAVNGQYWRLLTPVFLHAGLAHLAFNGYALFVIGRDTESFYGSAWFTAIYFLSGVAGSVAWYLLGTADPSLGASGAIFGLIGAEAAFFLRNRQLFGAFGRQRLANVAIMLAINLFLGFTIANVNNIAHLGGLVAGFLLGLALAPSYAARWSDEALVSVRRLVDVRSSAQRLLAVALTLVVLFGLILLGNQHWAA